MKVDVLPGDIVETLGAQMGLVVAVDVHGYAMVWVPTFRLRTFYGKHLKVLSRMPEEAGTLLEATFRLGGIEALSALRDDGLDGEPHETLRELLVKDVLTS